MVSLTPVKADLLPAIPPLTLAAGQGSAAMPTTVPEAAEAAPMPARSTDRLAVSDVVSLSAAATAVAGAGASSAPPPPAPGEPTGGDDSPPQAEAGAEPPPPPEPKLQPAKDVGPPSSTSIAVQLGLTTAEAVRQAAGYGSPLDVGASRNDTAAEATETRSDAHEPVDVIA